MQKFVGPNPRGGQNLSHIKLSYKCISALNCFYKKKGKSNYFVKIVRDVIGVIKL